MKTRIATYVAFILLVSAPAAVPAAPAAAHSGDCTVTGNTWESGGDMYGSGNVDCGVVHSKMYIQVTLEVQGNYGWAGLKGTSKEKTLTDVPSIYKQTSRNCRAALPYWTYRVRIFYKVWNNGQLDHADTVYRGQEGFRV
jgi:hypothetical protein